MSQQLVNELLVGGMAVLFLLIVGVLGAMLGKRNAVAPVPSWADADSVDLEDRLRKITLGAVKPAEDPAAVAAPSRIDTLAAERPPVLERPGQMDDRAASHERATKMFEAPPRVADAQAMPTTRLALPGSGTIKPQEHPAPPTPSEGEGLSPLAARFNAFSSPGTATGQTEEFPAAKRLELPGTVARDLGIPGFGDDAAGGNPFAGIPSSPPSTRLSLPGTVAGGFTEMPNIDLPSIKPMAPPSLPPSESTLRREAFGPPAARRAEPQRDPAAPAAEPTLTSPSMIDIRAILRGDAAPASSLPSADGAPGATSPTRKGPFTTGPLQPEVEHSAPLGGMAFDPNLLNVREPVPMVIEPPKSPTTSLGVVADYGGAPTFEAPSTERVAANGRLIDLDATRLVEDFDLPDTGFETHVFSTAELVEGESLGFPSFPAAMPSAPEPPLPPPPAPAVVTPIRAAMPAMGSAVGLSPLQEDQAQGHIAELAELVDVIFARLIGADGSVILSAGDDSGDAALGSHLASLVETAAMEVQQLDLGDWQSVSVESAGVALLIAPVNTSASVAVLLRNPTRLGLLRRQIRKPLSGLRSLLAESSVS